MLAANTESSRCGRREHWQPQILPPFCQHACNQTAMEAAAAVTPAGEAAAPEAPAAPIEETPERRVLLMVEAGKFLPANRKVSPLILI